ncbi:MAG: cupin [Actinomycetia bacterium]|nr:cupin [Actinomycetes bacterium]
MPRLLPSPSVIDVPGGKVINEHVGRVATGHDTISVAHMLAPGGWSEPAQRPEFDEVTLVLRGVVLVEHDGGITSVQAGQSIITEAGERVRYSCGPDGAEYVAVCLPAFSPETVNREEDQ